MKTDLGQMKGHEWEKYCQKLLRLRYDDYQEVPARFGGDLGIEGFTRSGLVFQCYCPDEDPSGTDLYEAQRNKITQDIAKLIKNADKISQLGTGTIQEWHFITPHYNSKNLVLHCRTKELEVRNKNLNIVNKEFIIYIKTEDDFIREREIFYGTSGHKVQPLDKDTSLEAVKNMLDSDNEIVQNIKIKLGKLKLSSEQQIKLTTQLVRGYMAGQSELETLNQKLPSTYKSIIQLKDATESQLEIRILPSDGHGAILNDILREYEAKLSHDFSGSLSSALVARLSTEAISDWLGRCPLDFPEVESTNEKH